MKYVKYHKRSKKYKRSICQNVTSLNRLVHEVINSLYYEH